jgi:hypothetical protein
LAKIRTATAIEAFNSPEHRPTARLCPDYDVDYILSGRLEKLEEVDYEGGVKIEVAILAQMTSISSSLKFFAGHSCTVILPISEPFWATSAAIQSITNRVAFLKQCLLFI